MLNNGFENSLFISLELIKIFIVLENNKIDFKKQEYLLKIEGMFFKLKQLLSYPNETKFRTIFNNRLVVNIEIKENEILFIPEDMNVFNKNIDYFIDCSRYSRILDIVNKYSNNNFTKKLLLMITLSSAIKVCSDPVKNKIIYYRMQKKGSEAAIANHEANFQISLASEIKDLNDSINTIVEKTIKINDEDKRPDIVVSLNDRNEYNDIELLIELKVGVDNSIVKRFLSDVEKSKKYYNFAIVLACDHMENIKEYLGLRDYKINKNMRLNQPKFYLEGKDDIYFVLNYEIVNKYKYLGLNNNKKRKIEQEIDKSIKLAFYIENKDL